MGASKNQIEKLWNHEFLNFSSFHKRLILSIVTFGALFYVVMELLLGINPFLSSFTIFNFLDEFQKETSNNSIFLLNLWLGISIMCMVIRITVIYLTYQKSKTAWGEESVFYQYFLTYFSAFIIAFIASALLQSILTTFYSMDYWLTGTSETINPIEQAIENIKQFFNTHVPNIISIDSKFLAFAISVCLASLAPYCIHRLSHSSRFCWLVFHRAHHCPKYLHPLATPPALVFGFLLSIPSAVIAISVSRLIHTEALVMELAIWSVLAYCLEIFNHADVLYRFAYSNPIVRNLSRLFGDSGVYHLIHHSSLKTDQNINFAGGPFNLWDRIFGTYRKPYKELPPLGLTNQPDIHMNPFRIIFSGIFQLAYELKMNKSITQKFRIIFGGINYKPEITRCYLKK